MLRFGNLRHFDALPLKHFNYTTNTFITMTSMRKGTSLGEAVEAINDFVEDDPGRRGNVLNN